MKPKYRVENTVNLYIMKALSYMYNLLWCDIKTRLILKHSESDLEWIERLQSISPIMHRCQCVCVSLSVRSSLFIQWFFWFFPCFSIFLFPVFFFFRVFIYFSFFGSTLMGFCNQFYNQRDTNSRCSCAKLIPSFVAILFFFFFQSTLYRHLLPKTRLLPLIKIFCQRIFSVHELWLMG